MPDALPPMDEEIALLLDDCEASHCVWVHAANGEVEALATEANDAARAALWAAVVAYGDRRAEEARAELIERMEDPLDPLCLRCYLAECKSAQSSPAPEGVDDGK